MENCTRGGSNQNPQKKAGTKIQSKRPKGTGSPKHTLKKSSPIKEGKEFRQEHLQFRVHDTTGN